MPTNFDHDAKLATRGQRVRITDFGGVEPASWNNVGVVRGITLDRVLTSMNQKGIQKYRILVDFGDGEIASVLPCILKSV